MPTCSAFPTSTPGVGHSRTRAGPPAPSQYAPIPLGFPAGPAGTADAEAQSKAFAASREVVGPQLEAALAALEAACPGGGCLASPASFAKLYNSLPAGTQVPSLANFGVGPHSDAAFARMRLTTAPLLIKRARWGHGGWAGLRWV